MTDTHRDRRSDAPAHRLRPLPAIIRHSLLASAGALLAQGALLDAASAAPQGGNVVAGQGQISAPDAATTLVHQQSHSMVVNWQSFDVAKPESVQFNQPSSSAAVLNRVLNQSASQIHGAVRANGQVFILNSSGVAFGKDARVDVGGLVVSSLDITNSDFMEGRYRFKAADGQTPGAIVNRGLIQAARGGSVTLVGGQVANEGVIVADAGHVNLAAGRTATLDFDGDGLLRFEVDGALLENATGADAAVSNSGEIRAEGGQVLLSARAASQVFDRAVNNSGLIRAGGIHKAGGKVMLTGFGGGVKNTGTVDASGSSGGEVRMVSDAVVEQFGAVRADGSSGGGGLVHLASLDTTLVGGDGVTSARSEAGNGGRVQVEGKRVGLVGTASVDVSGATGGGTVLVGGGYQGKDTQVRNATATVMGADVTINADSREHGNGGTVIVWADEVTRFHGHISARGGANGGDGGFVETSGKNYLEAVGSVNAGAPAGAGGTWLLDPRDVELGSVGVAGDDSTGGAFDSGTPNLFTPDNVGDATVAIADIDQIVASLEGGTSVTITTTPTGDTTLQDGDITVVDPIAPDLLGAAGDQDVTLTLLADRDIVVNNTINPTGDGSDRLSLVLTATRDVDVNAAIDLTGGMAGAGGSFTSSGVAFDNTGGVITTDGGTVNVNHTGAVTLGAAIDAGTVTATIATSADAINGAGLVTAVAVDLNAASGIGNTTPLNLAATTITADTGAGAIAVNNALATAVAVNSLTTTGAAITFDQIGLGAATFGTVTTTGANDVTLNAQAGLTLTTALSTGSGSVSLNADSDNVDTGGGETGTLNFGASTITTTGPLSLTAFTFGTTGTIAGPPSSLALNFTRNGNLTLGDQSTGATPTLTDAAMDTFTTAGGGVLALSTGGSIVLDRATAANGNLTLGAGTTITDNNTGLAWQNATGTLTLTAGGNVGAGGDNTLQVDLAALTVTDGGTLNVTNGDGAGGDTSAASTTYQLGTTTALGAVTVSQSGGAAVVGAGGIDSGGAVSLTTLSGANVTLTGATTAVGTATINAAGSINGAGLVTTDTVDLNAASGIGNTTALELAAATITADTTAGAISIDNTLAGAAAVNSLTTAGASVTFDHAGAGGVTYGTVAGDTIVLTSAGAGGLTVGTSVTAANAGDVTLTTTGGGSVVLTGTVTAANDQVTVNSAGTISQTGIIIGGPLSTMSTGGTTLGSANTVSAFAATNAGGGNVTLNNSGALALGAVNTGGGDLNVTNVGTVTVTGASATGGGALTLTTSAGAINGAGGSLNAGAGALTLNAATGIGTGGAIVSAGTGNVNLTTAGAGAAGNIVLTDTSAGAFATSLLTTLATTGSSQTITLTDAVGFNFNSNAAVAGLSTDTLNFNGATALNANLVVPAGSFVNINGATTVGAGGVNPSGAGSVTFNGAVASAQAFTVATAVANFTSDITMAGGAALSLNSADTNFTDNSNVITDVLNLGGGAGSVDGPGTLTILRASASAADTTIGGTDPLFSATNLAALGGFNGTLNIGGTRDVPPTAAQLLNNITVTGNLATAGNIFMVGGGDITFDNTVPGQGRFETSSPTGVITVAALGTAGAEESGNIRDTADFLSIGAPGRVAIVANTVELLAANQIGQEGGTGGGRLNIRVAVESLAQGVEGDALVDNGIFGAASSESVSEVRDTFAAAAAPGGALAGAVNFSTVNLTVSSVQLLATPKQSKGELGFIDEGVFLLPSAFTSPERALLMPLLGDADFPGDQRPQDPNDDAAWLAFFEDVLRPYIASRYPLGENATAQERAAVEALITRELETVIAYYEAVRERERTQLALEQAAREAAPPVPAEPGQNPEQELPVPPLQQGAVRPALEFGYVGQPWSRGGIGVEPRGWTPRGGPWPVNIAPTSG